MVIKHLVASCCKILGLLPFWDRNPLHDVWPQVGSAPITLSNSCRNLSGCFLPSQHQVIKSSKSSESWGLEGHHQLALWCSRTGGVQSLEAWPWHAVRIGWSSCCNVSNLGWISLQAKHQSVPQAKGKAWEIEGWVVSLDLCEYWFSYHTQWEGQGKRSQGKASKMLRIRYNDNNDICHYLFTICSHGFGWSCRTLQG